jgi:hypothetical protein
MYFCVVRMLSKKLELTRSGSVREETIPAESTSVMIHPVIRECKHSL